MSSEIKVSSVKAKDGTAGISIADSTGNVSLSGSLSAGTLDSSVVFPSGHVIQTEQYFTGETFTQTIDEAVSTSGNYAVVTDGTNEFKKSITSKKTNSKFLIALSIGCYLPHNTGSTHGSSGRILRDISGGTSNVSVGDSTSSHTPQGAFYAPAPNINYGNAQSISWQYLDSPDVSAGTTITYKLAIMPHSSGGYTIYFNYHTSGSTSGNNGYQASSASSLLIQEIAV